MIVRVAETDADKAACVEVRCIVFVEEQGVDLGEEIDGLDGEAVQILGLEDDQAVATMRIRILDNIAKIERVCVVREQRGTGAGMALMEFAHAHLQTNEHVSTAKLGAQTQALGFYERLGYIAEGDEFLDAGIPHYMMTKTL